MLVLKRGKFFGRKRLFGVIAPAAFFRDGGQQTAEQNVFFLADFDLDVLKFVVVSDGEVRRQRPRRRRPDQHKRVRLADDGKFHKDALADVVLVFDFGFGERGAAGNAPINRLFAAINETFFDDVGKQAQFVGLVFLVQREIRIVPIAEHAEAFELRALDVNVFAGVGFAGFADGGGVEDSQASRPRSPCAFPGKP